MSGFFFFKLLLCIYCKFSYNVFNEVFCFCFFFECVNERTKKGVNRRVKGKKEKSESENAQVHKRVIAADGRSVVGCHHSG